jgi:hypothetical protein
MLEFMQQTVHNTEFTQAGRTRDAADFEKVKQKIFTVPGSLARPTSPPRPASLGIGLISCMVKSPVVTHKSTHLLNKLSYYF